MRRWIAAAASSAAVVGAAAAPAQAGLLDPGTKVKVNAEVLGREVSTAIEIPEDPAPDAGPIGATGAALCDITNGLDGDNDGLSSLVCLLRSAELRIVTEFGAGPAPLRREHTGVVGVPNPIDADTVLGADLTVTATLGEDNRIVLDIDRVSTNVGPFPVAVEVFAADPSVENRDRRFGGGYDTRDSTAPQTFEVSVLPAQRPEIDIRTTGAGPSLTVLGDIFRVNDDGSPRDPLRARARFAPVPALASASFETTQTLGSRHTDADLAVSAPSRLDFNLETTTGTATTALDAFATLTDTVGVTVDTTPVADTVEPGAERLDVRVERGGPIALAGAAVRQLESGAVLSTSEALMEDLPATIDADVTPQTASAPLTVNATPSGPIGMAEVALGDGMAPGRLLDDRYVLRRSEPPASATTVRVRGLREAHVEVAAPDLSVNARLAAGPVAVDVAQPDLDVEGLVADVPDEVVLALRPDDGEVDYRGSAPIADLDLRLVQPAGIRTSTRTGVAADELVLDVAGVPNEVNADLVPDQGAPLTVAVGPQPLGRATAHLSSDAAGDGATLPAGEDGVFLRDVTDLNSLLVRLSGLRSASLRQSAGDLDVQLRNASSPPDLAVDIRQRPESGTGSDETITGALRGRPGCLRFAIGAVSPDPVCGGSQDPPPAPVPGQTHVRYEGDGPTSAIDVVAGDLEALPDRKDLHVELAGVPDRLDAEIVAPPAGLERVDVATTGGTLDVAQVRLTTGPADDALAPGRQGVLVRQNAERDVVLARATGLDRATVRFTPQLDAELRTVSGDRIDVDVLTEQDGPDQRVLAHVEAPPDCLRFTVGPALPGERCDADAPTVARSGRTNVTLQGSDRFGAVVVDEARALPGLPEGRAVHADLQDVPTLLAARISTAGDQVDSVAAEAPGELASGEVELEGGLSRPPVLGGGDGLFLREAASGALRLVTRVSRFRFAAADLDPLDIELRGSPPRNFGVDIVREIAGPDQRVQGTILRLPDCLRFQVLRGTTQGPDPQSACERTPVEDALVPAGVNIAYMASGIPAEGTDVDVDLTALPGLDPDAELTVDLDGLRHDLGAGVQVVGDALQRIRAATEGDPLGRADVRYAIDDDSPGPLPDGHDGADVALRNSGQTRAHARMTALRRADVNLSPLDVQLESGGDVPADVFFVRDPTTAGAAADQVEASLSRKPSCMRFSVQGGAVDGCGQPQPESSRLASTNISYLASETVPSVTASVRGLGAFALGQRLQLALTNVPNRVGTSVSEDAEGLDRVVASAAPAAMGTARVALSDAPLDLGDALTTSDGARLQKVDDRLALVVRVSGMNRADAEVRPLDIKLDGTTGPALDVDVDLLETNPADPSHLRAHATMTERASCMRFALSTTPLTPRCDLAPRGDVQRADTTNIMFENAGAEPNINVDLSGLDGLAPDEELRFDVFDLDDGLVAAVGSGSTTTTNETTFDTFGSAIAPPGSTGIRTTTTTSEALYIAARPLGDPVGLVEMRLRNGTDADVLAGRFDGLRIDDVETAGGTPDKGVFGRVTGFAHLRLDKRDEVQTREERFQLADGSSVPGIPFPDVVKRDYDVDFDSVAQRPFQVRYDAIDPATGAQQKAQADVEDLPSDLAIGFFQNTARNELRASYVADAAIGGGLTVDVRNLGGERTKATATPVPATLTLCANSADRCGLDLLTIDEDNREELDLSARLRSSEPVTIDLERCEQSGSQVADPEHPNDCTRIDGPQGPNGTKAVYVRGFRLEDIDLQVGTGREDRQNPDSTLVQILGIDSAGTSFGVPGAALDEAQLEVIDYEDDQTFALVGKGMRPVTADRRTLAIGGGFLVFLFDNEDWESGTLACPTRPSTDLLGNPTTEPVGWSFAALPHGVSDFATANLDHLVCSNR